MLKSVLSVGFTLTLSLSLAHPTLAQSITAAPDGTGTLIMIDGNTYHINGGTQTGANLFHSFQTFGLSSGEIASFLSNPSITNIFGRVTGGDPSIINGLIQANPNLYLMNPAGIIFGVNAQLNVGGDFVATTADRVGFESGWFNATGANDYAALVSAPNQFAFLSEQPGAILNFGDLGSSEDLSLVGGTVLNQGSLVASGNVTVAAVPGERLVRISQPEMLLSVEVPTDSVVASINPVDLPALLTGVETGANRSPGILPARGNTTITGNISGQNVGLYAAGQVTPTDANLIQGDVRVVRFSESGKNPDQAVFIDRRADHPEALLYGAVAGTVSQIIERDEDGISVISEQLSVISDSVGELESIAIVAEGNAGNFWLGNQWINHENVGNYAAQLQTWGEALTESADLLLYSCFTALGTAGDVLMSSFASLTGADVAASVDVTGSDNLGGDWDLEYGVGSIEAGNPFTGETLAAWDGRLAIFTVENGSDGGVNSLRDEISNANALAGADEIIFAPGVTLVTLTSGELQVTDDVTITGQGTNVTVERGTGAGAFRIFNISADNVTIEDLTIQNGLVTGASEYGGGIQHTGTGTLTLTDSTVSDNFAIYSGGGIHSRGDIELIGSTIFSNQVAGYGSSAYGDGGGIHGDGNVTITNSIVSANISVENGGGVSSNGNITIAESIISGNVASGSTGGGINSAGNVMVYNSVVSNNSARYFAGGINGNGNVMVTESTISYNSAGYSGGGVRANGSAIISDSTLTNNSAEYGGGIIGNSVVTIIDSTFSNNPVVSYGSDVFSRGNVEIINYIDNLYLDISADKAVSVVGAGSVNLTGDIQTNGNPVNISAGNNIDLTGLSLRTGSNGDSGDITITAGGNIEAREFNTTPITGLDAGDITLTSTGGSIDTISSGGSGSILATSMTGNGGNVTLTALQGIRTGLINTESRIGRGGTVTLETARFVQIQGELSPTDSNFNSFSASISSAGFSEGGSISIYHGGHALAPFIVGEASLNGTSAAITAGNGFTIFPTNSYQFSPIQPGMQSLTSSSGVGIATNIAGSEPINQYLDTQELIHRVGRQLDAETLFGNDGYFIWELPGERATGGWLDDDLVLQELVRLDTFLSDSFADIEGEAIKAEEEGEESDDEKESIANIRETFTQIQDQTGTTPVLIYALSNPDALDLILITPENQLIRKIIPEANTQELQKVARDFRRGIQNVGSNRYLSNAQQLYDWLIAPIKSELQGLKVDTLVFAMSPGLRTLPIAALHDGEQFLIEKYSLGQIPSVSLTNSNYQPLHNATVAAMGASEFRQLSPLPAVPLELATIRQTKINSQQYLNADFTFETLRDQGRKANDIVHLATHAAFPTGQDRQPYIQLWDEQIGFPELRNLGWHDDPQLELLVLSACETALGDPNAELGFAGLAVQTGVKSVLASLWQVSDLGTLGLMSGFYEQLNNPDVTIKAEALRQAQLALLTGEMNFQSGELNGLSLPLSLVRYRNVDLSHPYYWSAFTLVGSPW